MKKIILDCSNVTTEADFWNLYLTSAQPEYSDLFGRNLDAFWDALHGGPGYPGECAIKITNTQSLLALRNGQFYAALRDIASDCQPISVAVE